MSKTSPLWDDIISYNERYFPDWRQRELVYYSNALAGEVGEVCNSVKHLCGGGTHKVEVTPEKIASELFDSFVYMVLLLERLGYDATSFVELAYKKLEEIEERMR